MQYLLAVAFAALLASSASAAEISQSKATASALFRVKVAQCKDQAKAAGVKTTTTEWYTSMAGCIDKVTVTVASK
jgi:hypothetical protein